MIPVSLSATSAQVFEACPSRWRVEYLEKARAISGSAADLGTAVHAALEQFIAGGHHTPKAGLQLLSDIFVQEYYKLFGDDHSRLDEGLGLVAKWWERTNFAANVQVVSTEVKENFPISVQLADGSTFSVPFNYIFDRLDIEVVEDGTFDINVVDYKAIAIPLSPDEMRKKIQVRAYAVAALIKYPQARFIRVTYDMLRHEPVAVRFSRDDNVDTYRYLQDLLRRILNSDGTEEKLNPECRWCIRKGECNSLIAHANAGGILAITDPNEAADKRARLEWAAQALNNHIAELDAFLLDYLQREETDSFKTSTTVVEASVQFRRNIDRHYAARIIGPDLMLEYGDLKMGDVDQLLKDDRLSKDQKAQLKAAIGRNAGAARIKTRPIAPVGDDT